MSSIIGEGIQFRVTPVRQIQKAGLYSVTADTDTWSYMYRPYVNRWTGTVSHAQNTNYRQRACMFHVAPSHRDVNMC